MLHYDAIINLLRLIFPTWPQRFCRVIEGLQEGPIQQVAGDSFEGCSGFPRVGRGIPTARQGRMATLFALALGAVVSMPSTGLAEIIDEPAQFAVLGVGSAPCTSFIRAVGKTAQFTELDRQAMLSWAQGYLSFYNSVTEGTYDVTRGNGIPALENWLLEFCRRNPRASLINAVDDLLAGTAEPPLLLKPTTH